LNRSREWLRHVDRHAGMLEELHFDSEGEPVPEVVDLLVHGYSLKRLWFHIRWPSSYSLKRLSNLSLLKLRRLATDDASTMEIVLTWDLPCLTHLYLSYVDNRCCTLRICFPSLRILGLKIHSDTKPAIDFISNILRTHPRLIVIVLHSSIEVISLKFALEMLSNHLVCPELAHVHFLAYKESFHVIESAAHILIDRRPHIRIHIGVCDRPGEDPQTAPFAFGDAHPANVTVSQAHEGYQAYLQLSLDVEYDVEGSGRV